MVQARRLRVSLEHSITLDVDVIVRLHQLPALRLDHLHTRALCEPLAAR